MNIFYVIPRIVITSYSIHYTKLYELLLKGSRDHIAPGQRQIVLSDVCDADADSHVPLTDQCQLLITFLFKQLASQNAVTDIGSYNFV